VDDELLHFGFSFHYIQADYKIELAKDWGNTGYKSIYSPFSNNVGLGLLADLKLTENLNLRFSPNLTFLNVEIITEKPTEEKRNRIHRSNIELPLLLKFKSDRKGNLRGYLVGGGQSAINVSPSKRYTPKEDIITNGVYLAYTVGIGFDIYFDFFKMAPEIRWTQSIGNLIDRHPGNTYNKNLPLDRLFLRSFQISLFFE